jgi:D-alanyl-D-alanine carboxypeptidase (penicillin-binding protein 5/6)
VTAHADAATVAGRAAIGARPHHPERPCGGPPHCWRSLHVSKSFLVALLLAAGAAAAQVPATAQPEPTPAPQPQPQPQPQAAAPAPSAPQVPGTAWVLLDHTSGQVLAGHNEHQPVDPASITKVMTSYVVADALARGQIKPDDEVFISERAWRQGGAGTDGSFSGLQVNAKAKLDDIVHGLVIQSGNDAAIALAEHIAGSEDAFAELMNQYATRLGLRNSHFVNSHGLTAPGHQMSPYDIAVLSRALIRDFPEHYALYKVEEFTYGGIRQYNRNGLLFRDPSVDGIKTGHTAAAGYCLAASALRGDQRLISVVMGIEGSRAEGFRQREEANQALLNWGFRAFETHRLYSAGQSVADPPIWRAGSESVPLGVASDLYVTIPRGRYGELKAEMVLPELIMAPLTAGQEVGSVKVSLDQAVVAQVPLVTLAAHEEAGFFRRTWHDVLLLFE